MNEDRSAGRWCETCQQHGGHHSDKHPVWSCPHCEFEPYTEYGLKIHLRENHRTYGAAGQCQAYLLTPESRRWKKYTKQSIRCKYSAKDLIMPFCGNHAKLADAIEEIVWKEN